MALTDNLEVYYKLNETTGTTATDSTGNKNGTYVNSPTLGANGKIGTAVTWNGSNQYMRANNIFNNVDSDLSVSIWINSNETTRGDVVGQSAFFKIINGLGDDDKIHFYIYGSSDNSDNVSSAITQGTYLHAVGTYNKTSKVSKLYINGSQVDTKTLTGNKQTNTLPFFIGAEWDGGSIYNPFNGTTDECGVWSRELSSTEVTALYNSGNGITYPFSGTGPANLKSYNTNLKANIKSINTNLIGNIKSLNTNA